MTKKEIKERNLRLSVEMQCDPEKYIKAHEAIEILMNVSGLIDNAVQTIDELAPFLLYGKVHAYKDMQKALDKCVEYSRESLANDNIYMASVRDNIRIYEILCAILRMSDTEEGWQQCNAISRTYLENPKWQLAYRRRILQHGIDFWKVRATPVENAWTKALEKESVKK